MSNRAEFGVSLRDRHLLIVQRDPLVREALARYFRRLIGTVSVAGSAADAEAVFRDSERSPTDLICGQEFGKDAPLGSTLIAKWRVQHGALRRVILATGTLTLPEQLPGVDAVISKPADVTELVTRLLAA